METLATSKNPWARRLDHALNAVLYGFIGLLATPALTFGLGWLLFRGRETWGRDQGEGFVTTLFALYSAPLGAAFFVVAGLASALPTRPATRVKARVVCLLAWLLVCIAAFFAVVVGRW